ncbi:helix-turn-helix transcriptional regulator [Maribellus sp. CM-23]|uniref:helix-turn-helix domain-containing protein n=1 Tax=Maribellus sp. CM-23 TaxID=2781026 RepID=UPI001F15E88D|nr:AraC family transcriptional regulator [Maribellus sp. CM-23]MCE4565925.1 helix-turn-helix transcriptional regulator [Maribellus sp. CM-23]
MILHIKNMVCPRCIETVRSVLEEQGFKVLSIKLGEVEIDPTPSEIQTLQLSEALTAKGFELLQDKKSQTLEQIKAAIIQWVHYSEEHPVQNLNLSEYLVREIGADYSSLSHLFSASEEVTIEKFAILQKIERVKELLSYGELTTSEIAFKAGYSSSAHLSAQFKKETGITPGDYKKLKNKDRRSLDSIR